mmetsp:Transcript_22433/g.34705  ORF Transcript_22433/g.34705 Transcript_22433/m.34705 type:complete len:199 (+) Transcript_22433:325-921(+)
MTLVMVTLITGVFVNNPNTTKKEPSFFDHNRYSLSRAWKIYTILFEVTLTAEIIIVTYFWTSLYTGHCVRDRQVVEGWPVECWPTIMDHTLPLSFMLIADLVLLVPAFVRRHVVFVVIISIAYLITNFVSTEIEGYPVYLPINWHTTTGIIAPFVIVIIGIVLFLILEQLNKIKLKFRGYGDIVPICSGKIVGPILLT